MKKLFVLSAFLLAACQNTYDGAKAGIEKDSTSLRERIADNIYPEGKGPRVSGSDAPPPTYCYKSWTDYTCYNEPQVGKEALIDPVK